MMFEPAILTSKTLTPEEIRPPQTQTQENAIVLIDANVEDYAILAAGVRAGIEVAILHPAENGIAQISSILAERNAISTIHIISHGSPGCLYLGNTVLNLENLQKYAPHLRQWRQALGENAEIWLYGCNVAREYSKFTESPSLVTQLQQLTGANIAASATLTGNPQQGGSWNLEVCSERMVASAALTMAVQQSYTGVLAAGDLDPTFGTDGKVVRQDGSTLPNIVIEPNGKILIATDMGTGGSPSDFVLTRLNSDGSLDTSFGTGGRVTTDIGTLDYFPSLALQSDGKIVMTGGTDGDVALVRYNSDGTLDTSFNEDGKIVADLGFSEGRDITVASDGKILVAVGAVDPGVQPFGNLSPMEGEELLRDFTLARYNSDGSLDIDFGSDGKVTTDFDTFSRIGSHGLAIDRDGKIVATGSAGGDFALARYNSDGSLDTSFGNGGTVTTDVGVDREFARTIALQADGAIIIAGGIDRSDNNPGLDSAILRYNNDGSLDTSFGTNGIVTTDLADLEQVDGLAIQSDGKIVTVGLFLNNAIFNSDFTLVRYNSDGSLDTSFGTDGIVTTDFGGFDIGNTLALQTDNKIVVAGNLDNGTGIARYDAGEVIPLEPEPTPEPEPEPVPEPTPSPFPEGSDPNFDACQLVNNPPIFPSPNTTNDTLTGASLIGDENPNTLDATGETQGFILAQAGDDNLLGSPGFDRLFGNPGRDFINAGTGDDTVRAGKDNDGVLGGDGNDVISGGLGNDRILSGDGNDVVFGNTGIEYIDAGLGNDLVFGGQDNDGIDGGDGDDVLLGELGNDCLHGFSGNDLLFGNAGEDVLLGSLGSDLLHGGRGNDSLDGGFQSDVLRGDLGDDTLSGGEGGDRFDFRLGDGSDIITDFEDGVDIIGLRGGLTFAQLTISQVGSNTQISVGDEVLVSLSNVNVGTIDTEDFALV